MKGFVEVAADLGRGGGGQVAEGEFDAGAVREAGRQEGALEGQGEFVFFPVALDDVLVLDGEFRVEGHHPGVGLGEFLVEAFELVALGVCLLQRGHQVAGLCPQVVDRARGCIRLQKRRDLVHVRDRGGCRERADDVDPAADAVGSRAPRTRACRADS